MNNLKVRFKKTVEDIFGVWRNIPPNTPYFPVVYSIPFLNALESALTYFKKSQIFPIRDNFHWDIIPEMGINAVAFKENENEYVGVYFGLLSLLYHNFGTLFCHNDFLPELGENNTEGIEEDELLRLFTVSDDEITNFANKKYSFGSNFSITDLKFPTNSERLICVYTCGLYASMFTFFHEIGHIIRGHLDLSPSNKINHNVFFEFQYENSIINFDRRVLEIDADKVAMFLYLKFFIDRAKYTGENENQLFRDTWVSVLLFFIIADLKIHDRKSNSHPEPAYRYYNVKKMAINYFAKYNVDNFNTFYSIISNLEKIVKEFFMKHKHTNLAFYADYERIEELEKQYIVINKDCYHLIEQSYKDRITKYKTEN